MFVRGVLTAVALVVGLAVTGCQDDGATTSAEFVGPDTNALVLSYLNTCPDGETSAADGYVALKGIGYLPDAPVTLTWSVVANEVYGQFPGAQADGDGEFSAQVKLPGDLVIPGDIVEIWAQGSGPDGITAMHEKLTIGRC